MSKPPIVTETTVERYRVVNAVTVHDRHKALARRDVCLDNTASLGKPQYNGADSGIPRLNIALSTFFVASLTSNEKVLSSHDNGSFLLLSLYLLCW